MRQFLSLITPRSWNRLYFGSLIILTLLSWIRYLLSGKITVDNVSLESIAGKATTILFVASLIIHFVSFYHFRLESKSHLIYSLLIVHIVCLFMLPCISNDIFSLIGYSYSFDFSSSVFLNTIPITYPWIDTVSSLYKEIPCVYGILAISIAKTCIIPNQLAVSILLFKLIIIIFSFLASYYFLNKTELEIRNTSFLLLNPIWIIHGLGHAHIEALILPLVLLALTLPTRFLLVSAFLMFCAFEIKISAILLIPLIYLYNSKGKIQYEHSYIFFASYLFIFTCGIFTHHYLFGDILSITKPLEEVNKLWPSGTFSDYSLAIFKLTNTETAFSSHHLILHQPEVENATLFIKNGFKLIFVLYVLTLIFNTFRKKIENNYTLLLFCVLAVFLLYSHRYMTWYIVLALPCLLYLKDQKILTAILVFGLGTTIQDAAHFNHSHSSHIIIATFGLMITIPSMVYLLCYPFLSHNNMKSLLSSE